MFGISWAEALIVVVIAIIVIGPKELPSVIKNIGKFVRKVKSLAAEFTDAIEQETSVPKEYIKDLEGNFQATYSLDDMKPKPKTVKKPKKKVAKKKPAAKKAKKK